MATVWRRPSARHLALLVAMSFVSMGLWLTAAGPTFACSCAQAQPMAAYATADNAVFTGTTGPADARGVPVRVSTWFSGPGSAPIVYLSASSFGSEAACGIQEPPAGTEWIWVTYVPEGGGGDPTTGLCSPHALLSTPEGDALLNDAIATFGGAIPPGGTATDPPGAIASEAPSVPGRSIPAEAGVPIALLTLGIGVAVLLGVVVLARRRPGAAG